MRHQDRETITDIAKRALIEAFNQSGMTNAEFSRAAGISEASACHLRDPCETNKIGTIERGLRALGKRIEIKIVALLVALVIPLPAAAQPIDPWRPPCVITVDITVNTYVGPIDITDLCLSAFHYTGEHVQLDAIDLADGIFKDGFDGDGNP